MYGQSAAASIDWTVFRLTRLRVLALAGLFLSIAVGVSVAQFSSIRNLLLPGGAVVGGDYVAFYAASVALRDGEAAAIYDPETFEAKIVAVRPERSEYGLTWQYPPTYYFWILPFAFIAYAPGYALWAAGGAAAYLGTLRAFGFRDAFLFVVFAAPPFFQALITGQNGLYTAALLAIAALCAKRRPLIAGLAAALLTVKPQLGALIPFAFIAGGCWRAFAIAAAGSLVFVAASAAAFGVETWIAFVDGLGAAAGNTASGAMPLHKMATPFAAARLAGLGAEAAMALHALAALIAAGAVCSVWRRVQDDELRAAALIAAVFFAAPYGFYYELVALTLPLAIVARRGVTKEFLPFESYSILGVFALTLATPGEERSAGVAWGFIVVLAVAAIVVRRIRHETPGAFRLPAFRSARTGASESAD